MQRKIAENLKGLALEANSKEKKKNKEKDTVCVIIAVALHIVSFSDWTYNSFMYMRTSWLPIFFSSRITFGALEILPF